MLISNSDQTRLPIIAYKFAKYNPVDSVQYLLPNMGSRKAMIKHQPSMPWHDIPEFL